MYHKLKTYAPSAARPKGAALALLGIAALIRVLRKGRQLEQQ